MTIRKVRCRGGNVKFRALRLDTGNFSWGSQNCTRKTRLLDVNYNASNNELVSVRRVSELLAAGFRPVASEQLSCWRLVAGLVQMFRWNLSGWAVGVVCHLLRLQPEITTAAT